MFDSLEHTEKRTEHNSAFVCNPVAPARQWEEEAEGALGAHKAESVCCRRDLVSDKAGGKY